MSQFVCLLFVLQVVSGFSSFGQKATTFLNVLDSNFEHIFQPEADPAADDIATIAEDDGDLQAAENAEQGSAEKRQAKASTEGRKASRSSLAASEGCIDPNGPQDMPPGGEKSGKVAAGGERVGVKPATRKSGGGKATATRLGATKLSGSLSSATAAAASSGSSLEDAFASDPPAMRMIAKVMMAKTSSPAGAPAHTPPRRPPLYPFAAASSPARADENAGVGATPSPHRAPQEALQAAIRAVGASRHGSPGSHIPMGGVDMHLFG